ncbi:MAG: hypothetical protein NT039_01960 [Candidatus Berkelbacteria bacterium]|nr:hypothetical protein [Candidatus Berkelbacteria bacterium]
MKKKALTVVLGVVAAVALTAVIGFAIFVRMASDFSARRPVVEAPTSAAVPARSGAIPLAQLATQIPTMGAGPVYETQTSTEPSPSQQSSFVSPPAVTGDLYFAEAEGNDQLSVPVGIRARCYWEATSGATLRFKLMGPDISIDPTLAVVWVESTKMDDRKVNIDQALKGFSVRSTSGQTVPGQIAVVLRKGTLPGTGGMVELEAKEAGGWKRLGQLLVFAK